MKHLVKFNESKSDFDALCEYCLSVFAELIDDNVVTTSTGFNKMTRCQELTVIVNKKDEGYQTLTDILKNYKKWVDVLEDVIVAMKRLEDEYSLTEDILLKVQDADEYLVLVMTLRKNLKADVNKKDIGLSNVSMEDMLKDL